MTGSKQTKRHLKAKTPRSRRPWWKRVLVILGVPVMLLIVGCVSFGLVALAPDGRPLLLSLFTQTPELLLAASETASQPPSETAPATETLPGESPAAPASVSPAGTAGTTASPVPADTSTPLPTPDDVMRERHVPILMYHYISVPPAGSDVYRQDLSTTPEMFYRQMRWLKENGYNVISLEHLFYYLNTGWPELPPNPIVLTFDDGYVDNYEVAFPVLQKFGYQGTFFVLTDVTDRAQPGYMTWDMLRQMHSAGMDIQVHGREHHDMRGRDRDWLLFHLLGPAQTIHANLGYQPRFVAYPSGGYDAEVINVAHELGYWGAVTITQGSLQTRAAPFELRRLRVRGDWDLARFVSIVQEFSE